METLTLTSPEVTPQITTTGYRVERLTLDWPHAFISVHVRGTNGERKEFRYEGATATSLMQGLNTANLTIKSLHKRILERLHADGFLTGTVTGAPD